MNLNEELFHDSEILDLSKTRTLYVHTALGINTVSAKRGFYPNLPFATIQYAVNWFTGSVGSTYAKDINNQWTIVILNEQPADDITSSIQLPSYTSFQRRYQPTTNIRNTILSGPYYTPVAPTASETSYTTGNDVWLTGNGSHDPTGTAIIFNELAGMTASIDNPDRQWWHVPPIVMSFADGYNSKGPIDHIVKSYSPVLTAWEFSGSPAGTYYMFVVWDKNTNSLSFTKSTTAMVYSLDDLSYNPISGPYYYYNQSEGRAYTVTSTHKAPPEEAAYTRTRTLVIPVGQVYWNGTNLLRHYEYPFNYSPANQITSEKIRLADNHNYGSDQIPINSNLATNSDFVTWTSGSNPTGWYAQNVNTGSGIVVSNVSGYPSLSTEYTLVLSDGINTQNFGVGPGTLSGQHLIFNVAANNGLNAIGATMTNTSVINPQNTFSPVWAGTGGGISTAQYIDGASTVLSNFGAPTRITGWAFFLTKGSGPTAFKISGSINNVNWVQLAVVTIPVPNAGFYTWIQGTISNNVAYPFYKLEKSGTGTTPAIGAMQLTGDTVSISSMNPASKRNFYTYITTTVPDETVKLEASVHFTGSFNCAQFLAPDGIVVSTPLYTGSSTTPQSIQGAVKFTTPGQHIIQLQLSTSTGGTPSTFSVVYVHATSTRPIYNQDLLYGSGVKTSHIQNQAVTVQKMFIDSDLDMRYRDILNIGPNASLTQTIKDIEITARTMAFFGGN